MVSRSIFLLTLWSIRSSAHSSLTKLHLDSCCSFNISSSFVKAVFSVLTNKICWRGASLDPPLASWYMVALAICVWPPSCLLYKGSRSLSVVSPTRRQWERLLRCSVSSHQHTACPPKMCWVSSADFSEIVQYSESMLLPGVVDAQHCARWTEGQSRDPKTPFMDCRLASVPFVDSITRDSKQLLL